MASAPLPSPDGVLYAPPNPDGSTKSCKNCYLWKKPNRCAIHGPKVLTTAQHICGYHLFGDPSRSAGMVAVEPISPKLSGLERVPGGTTCGSCRYFTGSHCRAVQVNGAPAKVQALGCCARWDGSPNA